MKTKLIPMILASLSCVFSAAGQAPPDFSALCKEQMKKLEVFAGKWQGEASIRMGPGPEQTINQQEDVQFRIDSTVLVIEGLGTRGPDNTVVFNALAVINFNAGAKGYSFRSFLKDGRSADAYFNILEDRKFEWGFDTPGNSGKVRYTITFDDPARTWHEVGEFSADGSTWMKFMEMRLNRIN